MKRGMNESDIHYNAKIKLFNLIKDGKVTLIDQDNRIYDLYKGYEKEFLFVEPLVMIADYGKALLKDRDFPCLKFMAWNKSTAFNPYCDYEIDKFNTSEDIPCYNCLFDNLNSLNREDLFKNHIQSHCIIPDISYGTGRMHHVFIEVIYQHECSEKKRNIAKHFKIPILEVKAMDILNLKNDELICYNLNFLTEDDYKKITIKNKAGQRRKVKTNKNKTKNTTFHASANKQFTFLFEAMREELKKNKCIDLLKINNYIKEHSNYEDINAIENIDARIDRLIRNNGFSILNLETDFYNKEVLMEYNIDKNTRQIFDKELAKEIVDKCREKDSQ